MTNFNKKQLADSLFCPILTFLWGAVRCIIPFGSIPDFSSKNVYGLSFIAAMAVGGVLCVILTLALDIHTEYYLEKRLILIAAVFVFHIVIARFSVSSNMFYVVSYLLVGVIAYIVMFVKIRDVNTDFGEMTILVLSDPILYWTVYQTVQFAIWLD